MEFTIEKLFLAGLGSAIMAKEKVEETVNQLVNKGDLTKDQAKSLVDDLATKAESERNKFEARGKEELRKFFTEQNLAFVEDLKRLENRLAYLEEKVNALSAQGAGHAQPEATGIITP
ncbi:MAG TPA: hypothetical protein VGO93_13170 [Candidatus Xenobia bacterium]|jgi:polyhydroxyalkanoate synthesis regulator phasin